MELVDTTLTLADQRALWAAACTLERENLVGRLCELTGEPVTQVLHRMPKAISRRIHGAVNRALWQALDVALYKIDALPEPGAAGFKMLSCVTGGVSGFFGAPTLAVELPVTTTLMLRSIAGIARKHGEDLKQISSRLACLEVFALGPRMNADDGPVMQASYYAARAFLARAVGEAAQMLAERGMAQRSVPVIIDLITAIGSRFGLVVSEKVAAGAIPVIGAIGGAAINIAFMQHFQKLAEAHFGIRALERQYGLEEVHRVYQGYAQLVKERAAAKAS